MTKYIVGLLILLVGVGYLMFNKGDRQPPQVAEDSSTGVASMLDGTLSGISADGNIIKISSVTMGAPGFIVIKEVINKKPGQIVEISEYLDAGEYTDIEVELPEGQIVDAVDFGPNGFPVQVELAAVIYTDNGNKTFNDVEDTPANAQREVLAWYVVSGERVPTSAIVLTQEGVEMELVEGLVVRYTQEGFVPAVLDINAGDTVTFVNESSRPMWVASNVHPAHTILPTFDQFKGTGVGSKYSYTFEQSGNWRYHDHISPAFGGVINVK